MNPAPAEQFQPAQLSARTPHLPPPSAPICAPQLHLPIHTALQPTSTSSRAESHVLQDLGKLDDILPGLKDLVQKHLVAYSPGAATRQTGTGVSESSFRDAFSCEVTPLWLHLSSLVREKIVRGDYIDLLSLLPSSKEFLKNEKRGDNEEDRRRPVARTFSNWLQAFCIYANILTEKHPEIEPGLFKHVDMILEAYKSYGGCRFKHECAVCNGPHPAFRCLKRFLPNARRGKEQHNKADNTSEGGKNDDDKFTPIIFDNLKSAKEHPDVVNNKILKEVKLNRIEGPFTNPPFLNFRVSPLARYLHAPENLKTTISNSIAKKSWSFYVNSWSLWSRHVIVNCNSSELDNLIHLLNQTQAHGKSPNTMKKHIAGISFFLKLFDRPDITKKPIVKQLLKGYQKAKPAADKRKPITLAILLQLVCNLRQMCTSEYEYVIHAGGLNVNDVGLKNNGLQMVIRQSKTDTEGKGDSIWLSTFNQITLCPIKAYSEYIKLRGSKPGPFFMHQNGEFLSRFQFSQVLKKPKTIAVFIIGHSYIYRAVRRAAKQEYGTNLNLNKQQVKVTWLGLRGAIWHDLLAMLSQMISRWGQPDIVLIHLGGNDIGKEKTIEIIRFIRRDLAQLHFSFPEVLFVWSEIVSRITWFQSPETKALDRCHKKINSAIAKFAKWLNVFTYRHTDLELTGSGLYRDDGVHLSDIGLDIFNNGLRNAIELAISKWKGAKAGR
ncbi:hypothetical protein XELAEV_18038770mg [Xenopus laevis]|uniref:SGNH hydrolase-type esterase domain-containing protein n=1 Tax=Xenopus laevis TaxID=8355 RepID=A0A974H795_XENLA|nr:hypothetical protein XELAEV_18038770mg [Xenopus laevis]